MNPFYEPAFWLLGRISQGAGFALVGLLFLLSTLVALAVPAGAAAWVPAALLALLGCYGLAAGLRVLPGGGGQFLHAGGGFLQRGGLLVGALGQLGVAGGDAARTSGDDLGAGPDLPHDQRQAAVHLR
ncbi:MAG: hypothetical protein EOO25_19930, partial [Comamonadaceae bacterium]